MQNKYTSARKVIEEYTHAYLQGDTMLHIQEWVDEKGKEAQKTKSISIDEDGHVTDIHKTPWEVCECCGSQIKYLKVSFSKYFIPALWKILDHVTDIKKKTGTTQHTVHIRDLKLSHIEYTILNKIANFGLLYREKDAQGNKMKHGVYGVPQKRIFDFLNGEWKVAKFYVVKSSTHERILSKERVTVDEIHKDQTFKALIGKMMPAYVGYIPHEDIW